jgi:hypothetical protein
MGQATNMAELEALLAQLHYRADEDHEGFVPRPTDVIISPFPKCGTTWLQQIVHTLRTGGDTDYEDIYEVVPYISVATQLGIDLDAEQRAEPRAFKSHRSWNAMPSGCRYIVSFRDPKDAIVSEFHFLGGWLLETDSVSLDEYAAARLFAPDHPGSYWQHTASWLTQRDNPDVLLLTFDDMKRNLSGVVRRIARFIEIRDDQRIATATEHASFAHMSAHPEPFQEPWLLSWSIEHLDLPVDVHATKVNRGEIGGHRQQLAPRTAARIDEIWRQSIGKQTGHTTYAELVQDLSVA